MQQGGVIVQPDLTILLETEHPDFNVLRHTISKFAELIKTPPKIHTYRITAISLWHAASVGMAADDIVAYMKRNNKFGAHAVPSSVLQFVHASIGKFNVFQLERLRDTLVLCADTAENMAIIYEYKSIMALLRKQLSSRKWEVDPANRGLLKQELIRLGYPVKDLAGYQEGEHLAMALRETTAAGKPFALRDYQTEAKQAFIQQGSLMGGSGLITLPCGAGKTIVGIAVMAQLNREVLILTSNHTSVLQWKEEILDKTTITEDQIGEYSSYDKQVRPITIATYQMLTYRRDKSAPFEHMQLFQQRNWGLIIYDEVHLLPAPVFRATAELQATRRLGLTATLIREDGLQEDVFSLVGPKKYDMQWKDLEAQGWLARVYCTEIRVPMPQKQMNQYEKAGARQKFRIACENPIKQLAVAKLLRKHAGLPVLIIGQYINQLQAIAEALNMPLITGRMPNASRAALYRAFKSGEITGLVVSKVANFAIDLPDAALLVQISGSYGSRQEEAQRLGRILRPKHHDNTAYFYTIVSGKTAEQDYAMKRQLFLVEQGYEYGIVEES